MTHGTAAVIRHKPSDLPPVTEAHRLAAFALMAWRDCTYEAALCNAVRFKLLEARAAQLRTREWMATQRPSLQPVKRVSFDAEGKQHWVTQQALGPLVPRDQEPLIEDGADQT